MSSSSTSSWNNSKKWSSIRNDQNDIGTSSRRQTTIQIRKQRKEDMLRRKRGIQSSTIIAVEGSFTDSIEINESQEKLRGIIDQYCMNHPSRNHPGEGNTLDVRHPILLLYESFMSIPHTTIINTLEQCIRSNNVLYGNILFQNLLMDVQNENVQYAEMAAIIFVEITSIQFTNLSKTTNDIDDDMNYYGPTSSISKNRLPYWYELFITNDPATPFQNANEYKLLPNLFQIINTETTSIKIVELLCNMLGNVILQQWDGNSTTHNNNKQQLSITFMEELLTPTNWSILIHKLPYSCYCCSCIIRVDTIHYGMDFLRPLQQENNNNNNSLIYDTFSKLLLDDEKCVETVWMLEGLTRRETNAVYALFSLPNESNNANNTQLLLQLIQLIHNQALTATTKTTITESHQLSKIKNENLSKYCLVPALRTIGNIAVAFNERHNFVQFFERQPLLIISINYLLEERILIDTVYTANTLLYLVCRTDSIVQETRNDQLSTLMKNLIQNFIPRLVHIVTNQSNPSEWRRESMLCIVDVIIDNCAIYDLSQSILQDYVWHTDISSNHNHLHHTSLMQSLLDMLSGNDNNDVVRATMKLLNRLLRTINESRTIFINLHGVEKLEDICSTINNTYDEDTQEIAVQLLDEYFENDDNDEIESEMNQNGTVIEQTNQINEFSFGISSSVSVATPVKPQDSTTISANTDSPYLLEMTFQHQQQPTVGRGRGRVIPAWMAQQQN